jgi:UDP-glucose 4-epimerase
LTERLIAAGHHVAVLDDLSQGKREWVPRGAELIVGDVTDLETCKNAVRGAAGVFHLAAMSKAGPSFELTEFCTRQNVLGTMNMLLASREMGVKKLVYAASSTAYGNAPGPHREDMAPQWLNPYALSKYVGELYCRFFTETYGFPTLSLRFFNVYGPRQPKQGAYALVMGIFLDRKRRGETLEIHGDGSQRRDFVHVVDVADAMIAAWNSPAKGMTLNVGSGRNVSIRELAELISKDIRFVPRRAGDAEVTLADLTLTRRHLTWQPKISLEVGLRQMIDLKE